MTDKIIEHISRTKQHMQTSQRNLKILMGVSGAVTACIAAMAVMLMVDNGGQDKDIGATCLGIMAVLSGANTAKCARAHKRISGQINVVQKQIDNLKKLQKRR